MFIIVTRINLGLNKFVVAYILITLAKYYEKKMKKDKSNKFSIRARICSAKYAWHGLGILFKEEHNSRIHTIIAIVVIISGFLLHISSIEWLIILLLIASVFSLEIVNSAIENICDFVSPQYDDTIKKVKDLSAAAVLVASVISVICGLIIFVPKIYQLFV